MKVFINLWFVNMEKRFYCKNWKEFTQCIEKHFPDRKKNLLTMSQRTIDRINIVWVFVDKDWSWFGDFGVMNKEMYKPFKNNTYDL